MYNFLKRLVLALVIISLVLSPFNAAWAEVGAGSTGKPKDQGGNTGNTDTGQKKKGPGTKTAVTGDESTGFTTNTKRITQLSFNVSYTGYRCYIMQRDTKKTVSEAVDSHSPLPGPKNYVNIFLAEIQLSGGYLQLPEIIRRFFHV